MTPSLFLAAVPTLVIPALAIGVVVLWIQAILFVVAWIGGWARLAAAYPGVAQVEGERWRFRSLRLGGWTSYNNCVTLGGDRSGLHLSMPRLFASGHPPIFIPWGEIRVAETRSFFGFAPWVGLTTRQCPSPLIWLPAALLREIQETVKRLPTARATDKPAGL